MTRTPRRTLDDTQALDRIHGLLTGREWSGSDDLEAIAEIVGDTGRVIASPVDHCRFCAITNGDHHAGDDDANRRHIPGCPNLDNAWDVFDTAEYGPVIQRCDSENRLDSDAEAFEVACLFLARLVNAVYAGDDGPIASTARAILRAAPELAPTWAQDARDPARADNATRAER